MSQRIKPDRPIWPPLPDSDVRTAASAGPAEGPRGAPPAEGGAARPGTSAPRDASAAAGGFGPAA